MTVMWWWLSLRQQPPVKWSFNCIWLTNTPMLQGRIAHHGSPKKPLQTRHWKAGPSGLDHYEYVEVLTLLQETVQWEAFLANHDMVWDTMPRAWYEGPVLGNGMLGAMLYQDGPTQMLRMELGRSDAIDHRDRSHGPTAFSKPRLPIGHFCFVFPEPITHCQMRLDLWNAELRGSIGSAAGEIQFRLFVHSQKDLIVCHWEASGSLIPVDWVWIPQEAKSPRQLWGEKYQQGKRRLEGYVSNPPPVISERDGVRFCKQTLLAGGETVTAWKQTRSGGTGVLTASVAHSWPAMDAGSVAEGILRAAAGQDQLLLATHRSWWHLYYPQSFVSLADTQLESFYWIQMYKMGCATRSQGPVIDNQGPWLAETAWPYATWNLNVQLTYWPYYASNRLQLAESLWRSLDRYNENVFNNVPDPSMTDSAAIGTTVSPYLDEPVGEERGNLLWALHNCWLHYRSTMDTKMLKQFLFPMLVRAVNFYRHLLYVGQDGCYHLPESASPEYGTMARDCNYDLALLRWGCTALLEICHRHQWQEPLAPVWADILESLVQFPQDETGFMIGDGVPYATSHRHFSHLLMIYPLYLVHPDEPENIPLIRKSMKHWLSYPEKLRGYSFTGAASMAAVLGDGDTALDNLEGLWEWLQPNTMYKESGPVIETPLACAQTIHDLLLQSWGQTIRVFPAVPQRWPDVTFHNMRAAGAFLVSATRRDGKTIFVRIKSLAGEVCRVTTDIPSPVITTSRGDSLPVHHGTDGILEIHLGQGEEVMICPAGSSRNGTIEPVQVDASLINYYGLNAKQCQPNLPRRCVAREG